MAYNLSSFNVYSEAPCFVANTMTGGIVQLELGELKKLCSLDFDFQEDEIDILREQGIIIDDNVNEVELLRNAYDHIKHSRDSTTFTIAPTLDCNFACPYCYEKPNNKYMTLETQHDTIEFIKKAVLSNNLTKVVVCWYGGEPLLATDIIRSISKELIFALTDIQVEYSASIITNGYLIDEKVIQLFEECMIHHVQITIDGKRETHNSRRMIRNGKGTFDVIVENAKRVASAGISVSIRTNIDKTNIMEHTSVVQLFKDTPFVDCYTAPVTLEETQNEKVKSFCYTPKELSQYYRTLISLEGWDNISERSLKTIDPVISSCAAEHEYSFVIGPTGSLFKCLNEVGHIELSVGDVKTGLANNTHSSLFMDRDPFTEEECSKCAYLPVCYGGCLFEYKKNKLHACNGMKFMYIEKCKTILQGGEKCEGN